MTHLAEDEEDDGGCQASMKVSLSCPREEAARRAAGRKEGGGAPKLKVRPRLAQNPGMAAAGRASAGA